MLFKSAKFLATFGLYCSVMMSAQAANPPTSETSTIASTEPGIYSILSGEQLKEHKKHRMFFNQDVAHTVDSDPLYPYHANPLYSFIGYERFITPAFSIGVVLDYLYQRDKYTKNPDGVVRSDTMQQIGGFLPYINYLLNRSWLVTAQLGGFVERDVYSQLNTDGSTYMSNYQIFTPDAEAYLTWIGPSQQFTASIRGGVYYTNQRIRSNIDSTGFFFPVRHFEVGAAAISARLKYYPDSEFWNAFLQVETDWRFFAGARPYVTRPDNARNNMQYIVGPGVHFKLNETWELRVMALHTIGFGYGKEERLGIRLRAAF